MKKNKEWEFAEIDKYKDKLKDASIETLEEFIKDLKDTQEFIKQQERVVGVKKSDFEHNKKFAIYVTDLLQDWAKTMLENKKNK